jgi:hypothetical protein
VKDKRATTMVWRAAHNVCGEVWQTAFSRSTEVAAITGPGGDIAEPPGGPEMFYR